MRPGRYDAELQMFAEPAREPDLAWLRFLRWLAEGGRLEHGPLGEPAGEYADLAETPAHDDVPLD